MKKHSFFAIGLLAIVTALSALAWVPERSEVKNQVVATAPAVNMPVTKQNLFAQYINEIYSSMNLGGAGLDTSVFRKAVVGYYNLKHNNLVNKSIVTIVDFTKSSKQKRLWTIDLLNKKLLFNTLVAHGQGSGDDMAQYFSNKSESHQSSLGFYVTDGTYQGKHGLSLKLNGMDEGFNTKARERAVVMHGAEYVSENFIRQHGRLGRSHGCPALPPELTKVIIDTVKGKSCLYINGPQSDYRSNFLNQEVAISDFAKTSPDLEPAATLSAATI